MNINIYKMYLNKNNKQMNKVYRMLKIKNLYIQVIIQIKIQINILKNDFLYIYIYRQNKIFFIIYEILIKFIFEQDFH